MKKYLMVFALGALLYGCASPAEKAVEETEEAQDEAGEAMKAQEEAGMSAPGGAMSVPAP